VNRSTVEKLARSLSPEQRSWIRDLIDESILRGANPFDLDLFRYAIISPSLYHHNVDLSQAVTFITNLENACVDASVN
jgi:hypothetical protein